MSTTTPIGFDVAALVVAIQTRDAAARLALYAPDAEVCEVDQRTGPSSPRVLRGHAQLGPALEDVCARDMTHAVTRAFTTADHLALEVDCAYPDGTRVLCQSVADLRDGRITRERTVTVWDG